MTKGVCCLTVVAVFGWLAAGCSSASVTDAPSTPCTVAALHGTFGSQRNGQAAPGTMISEVGLASFDGQGTLTEEQQVVINGAVVSTPTQTATYAVNSDCTGTLSDAGGNVIAQITVVHDATEVLGMSTALGSNMSMHFEKTSGPCSVAVLKGRYGFQRNGTTKAGSLLAIGTIMFDGAGNWTAQQIIDRSGTFGAPTSQNGSYTVNPDCTSSSSDTTGAIFTQNVVVGGGDEVLGISVTPGNNVVTHYERLQ